MLSTVSFNSGGQAMPPFAFRGPSTSAADPPWRPADVGFGLRRGARNKLRIANFLTCSGSPGIWGPAATNGVLLAASEINKHGGILGREVEMTMLDAGGPISSVAINDADLFVEKGARITLIQQRPCRSGAVDFHSGDQHQAHQRPGAEPCKE